MTFRTFVGIPAAAAPSHTYFSSSFLSGGGVGGDDADNDPRSSSLKLSALAKTRNIIPSLACPTLISPSLSLSPSFRVLIIFSLSTYNYDYYLAAGWLAAAAAAKYWDKTTLADRLIFD